MKKIRTLLLLAVGLILLATVSAVSTNTSQATVETMQASPKRIMISCEDETSSLTIPTYKMKNDSLKKTDKKLSILNPAKTRLKVFQAQKVKINGKTYWKIANNEYINNDRVAILK